MSQTRKQLQLERTHLETILNQQQLLVNYNKAQLSQYKIRHGRFIIAAIALPLLVIGWKANHSAWINKLLVQTKEILSVTFFSYFRSQLLSLFTFI